MKVELFDAVRSAVETLQAAGAEVSFATVGHAAATVYLTKRPPDEFIRGEVSEKIDRYSSLRSDNTMPTECSCEFSPDVTLRWDGRMLVTLTAVAA